MFLHVSVSHSVHKGVGSASVHAGIANTPPPGSRPSREQTPDPHRTRPPGSDLPLRAQCMLGERAVHISLECILVFKVYDPTFDAVTIRQ